MLVLSRKVGDEIKIGDDVVLVVVRIERGKVRLGVKAPKGTPVFRSELLDGSSDAATNSNHPTATGGTNQA